MAMGQQPKFQLAHINEWFSLYRKIKWEKVEKIEEKEIQYSLSEILGQSEMKKLALC